MPRVTFEPTIPVFERANTVHAFRQRGHCDRRCQPIARRFSSQNGTEEKTKITSDLTALRLSGLKASEKM
jgi:hypothetical protein